MKPSKAHLDPIIQEQLATSGLKALLIQNGELYGVQSTVEYLLPQIEEFDSLNGVLASRLQDGRIHPVDLERCRKALADKYKSMLATIDRDITANDRNIEQVTESMKADITRSVASDFALIPLMAKFVPNKKKLIELAGQNVAYGRLAVGAAGLMYGVTEDEHGEIIAAALPEKAQQIELMFSKAQALAKTKKLVEQSIGEVVDLLFPTEKPVDFLGIQINSPAN